MHAAHFASCCMRVQLRAWHGTGPRTSFSQSRTKTNPPPPSALLLPSYDRGFASSSSSPHLLAYRFHRFFPRRWKIRSSSISRTKRLFRRERGDWSGLPSSFRSVFLLLLLLSRFRRQRSCKDGGFATRRGAVHAKFTTRRSILHGR